MAKNPNRLAKGLDALVGPRRTGLSVTEPAQSTTNVTAAIREVPLDSIQPNRHQPRTRFDTDALEELAASIRENGVIQPIVLRAVGPEQYELIAGERRWRAAQLAQLDAIPAVIKELSDNQALELALVENIQREDLGPLERATAYQNYLDTFGGTIEALSKRLGESRANIANYLRLLNLTDEVRALLDANELSMGHARAIAGIADPQRQLALARLAVRRNLSVRQVEELARPQDETKPASTTAPGPRSRHYKELEEALSKSLGTRVKLIPGRRKNSGRIVIRYANLEEFDRITERLNLETSP